MRIRRSYLWALVLMVGIAAWLGSGILMRSSDDEGVSNAAVGGDAAPVAQDTTDRERKSLQAVRVAVITASERRSALTLRGRSEAVRRVEVRSQTNGQVTATPNREGTLVEEGAVLCQLDIAERRAMVAEAKAAVDQAELDFSASTQLSEKGYAARTQEKANAAKLDSARAMLKRAEIGLDYTTIRAPFTGVLEEQAAEVGSYLSTGGSCARLVELDPMLVVGQVSERDVADLEVGMAGVAHPVTGDEIEGRLRFIGSSADTATRTFRIELEVPNRDWSFREGVTTEIVVPLEPEVAHHVAPSLLTLGDDGRIGVRTIDATNTVAFRPVRIIADDREGVWIAGLPDQVTVITVGQEYVRAGQTVRPVFQTADADR